MKAIAVAGTLFLVGLVGVAVQAGSIGVNFVNYQAMAEKQNLLYTEVAGAYPQDYWNNTQQLSTSGPYSTSNIAYPVSGKLVDDGGNVLGSTTIAFSCPMFYAVNRVYDATTLTPNQRLMNGYLDQGDPLAPVSVTFTGIPYALYDVYAYVGSETNNRYGWGTINSQSYWFTTMTSSFTNFVEATATTQADAQPANYLHFRNLTGSSFTYTHDSPPAGPPNYTINNDGLFGIQIVEVPEPATVCSAMVVLALGLAACAARRGFWPRRRFARKSQSG